MEIYYFNHTIHQAAGRWERRDFVHKWWRLHRDDARWTPPFYPLLRQMLTPPRLPGREKQPPAPLHLEALARRRQRTETFSTLGSGGFLLEEPVAATVLVAPQPETGAAYLALLHFVNDSETLARLIGEAQELAWSFGCQRLIGPTALSPYLPAGVLHNYFHVTPPLHTPYNPPYVPELIAELLEPIHQTQLYYAPVTPTTGDNLSVPKLRGMQLTPFTPMRLADDLLPLFRAAQPFGGGLAAPSAADAALVLTWLQRWPLYGWLAEVDQTPVGFVLLQPDLAPSLRRANGGRNLLWRLWLDWRSRRPTVAGRVLYAAVLPAWRGQGIGRLLWQQALHTAQAQGWRSVTAGPVLLDSPAAQFLAAQSAEPQQHYVLYSNEIEKKIGRGAAKSAS